jgi:hypothetical protein
MPLEGWVQHSRVDQFLYDWQTLIAGVLAFVAGFGTVVATMIIARSQIKASQEQADRMVAAAREQTTVAQRQVEASQRQFELEGPFLQPIFQSPTEIAQRLKLFSIYDHPTSLVTPVSSEAGFTIRNVGRSPALLKSIAVQLDHWTEMVPEPRVDFRARFNIEPVIEDGDETKEVFSQTVTVPIDKLAFKSLKSGASYLFLYGEIAFSDLLGADYVQTFCFAYDFLLERFVRWGGRYNKRTRTSGRP